MKILISSFKKINIIVFPIKVSSNYKIVRIIKINKEK